MSAVSCQPLRRKSRGAAGSAGGCFWALGFGLLDTTPLYLVRTIHLQIAISSPGIPKKFVHHGCCAHTYTVFVTQPYCHGCGSIERWAPVTWRICRLTFHFTTKLFGPQPPREEKAPYVYHNDSAKRVYLQRRRPHACNSAITIAPFISVSALKSL